MVVGASMLLGRPRKTNSCNRGDEEQEQPPIQDPRPYAFEEVDTRTLQVGSVAWLRAPVVSEARVSLGFFLTGSSSGQAQVFLSPPEWDSPELGNYGII
jgi:hypothetical protein